MKMTRIQSGLLLLVTLTTSLSLLGASQVTIQREPPRNEGGRWTENIRCSIPVKPGERLTLMAAPGSVNVKTVAMDHLECLVHLAAYNPNPEEAKNCLDHYSLKAQRVSGGAVITGRFECGSHPGSLSAAFEIDMPLKFSLDAQTQGGQVQVDRLEGSLRVETSGGDIRAGNVTGPVWVKTSGGMIRLGNVGQNVQASTAGGNIQVGNVNGSAILDTGGGEISAGIVNGPVRAQTGGGDILLKAASGPVVVGTGGGQIHLGECGNTVRAQTAAGNIRVAGARGGVRAQTSGGSIDLLQTMSSVLAQTSAGRILAQIDANKNTFAPSRLETQVGDVDVFIPPNLPVNINAVIGHALGHRIVSDFPIKIQGEGGNFMAGAVRGEGALNGGGSDLDIHTLMGNIQIRKLDSQSTAKLKSFQNDFWKQWEASEAQRAAAMKQVEELQRQLEKQRADLQEQLQRANSQRIQQIQRQIQAQEIALHKQLQGINLEWVGQLEQQIEEHNAALRKQLQDMNQQLQDRIQQEIRYVGGQNQ